MTDSIGTTTRVCEHCEEYDRSMEQIIGAQMLASIHGMDYTGEVFIFCPFCGNKLTVSVMVPETDNCDCGSGCSCEK